MIADGGGQDEQGRCNGDGAEPGDKQTQNIAFSGGELRTGTALVRARRVGSRVPRVPTLATSARFVVTAR